MTTDPPASVRAGEAARTEALAVDVPEFEPLAPDEARAIMAAGGAPPLNLYNPTLQEYNPQKHLDDIRAKLALFLVWILVGVVSAGVVLLLTAPWTGVDKIANIGSTSLIVFSNIVTLVSAATGFYFGQRQGVSGKGGS